MSCNEGKKKILITGCTSGIGLETSKYLQKQGYDLLLVGRDASKLRIVSDELGGINFTVCDLEKTDSIKDIFEYSQKNSMVFDGLVHCAGYAVNMPIKLLKADDMERQMRVHYFAFLELCKFFSQKDVSNRGSSIVALSSLATITKRKMSTLYSASKSALNTAISVASKEFVKRNIRVNGIMPAYVDTRMNDGLEDLINIKERQPMGLIPPIEIAYLIEYLLSDKSKSITGALIPVSAGMEF